MTITDSSGSLPVDIFATPGSNTYNVDATGLAAINSVLSLQGSEYQFLSLGGSSNFPGNFSQGNLVLTGEVHSVVGGGSDSFLQITESESAYTNPVLATGTLLSASTGNFTNQPGGGGHTASTLFNTTSTPTYSVLSSGPNVNPEGAFGSATVSPVSVPYTLTNLINFNLSPAGVNDVVDSFSVTATISAVPEPTSMMLLLTGAPVFVILGVVTSRRRLGSVVR
jgi:hypothetical protein